MNPTIAANRGRECTGAAKLKTRSLRFWIGLGLFLSLVPLAASAIGSFLLLKHGVIAAFEDVAHRQRDQIVPAEHLRLLMWETTTPVDEAENGDTSRISAYRALREKIEAGFADLIEQLADEPAAQALAERTRQEWTAADHNATALISVAPHPGDPDTEAALQRFHGEIAAASDKLGAVYDRLAGDINDDHDSASRVYERSLWIAGIAAAISLLTAACGLFIIGRIMAASVDRLVEGAERFARGDRDHRIEVQVPPELHRVAHEFNKMIVRIRESEAALDDLAHRDSLTHLPNRRAFDETFRETTARFDRHGEPAALLILDVDHFKRVNDTYGHSSGDEVLRNIAGVIVSHLRPTDRAFRVGGEEFFVLLGRTDLETARSAAERLRRAVEESTARVDDAEIRTTVSIGVAAAAPGLDEAALIEAADKALYRAKETGRNRVELAGENGETLRRTSA